MSNDTTHLPDPSTGPDPQSGDHRVEYMGDGYWRAGDTVLTNVHPKSRCAGRACVMHSPTDHALATWPLTWDQDRLMVERICEHDQRHPDPDSLAFAVSMFGDEAAAHECDGCCTTG